ncbi:MAG: Mu-like prophage major head subunit gpT family protein [Cohaesibacteraceae bacterium]|nr:Mu-like prophage major head subunit gpT family protein [Cohaesibacteraceae bacterium]
MADANLVNLKTAGVGFKNNYQKGFDSHEALWSTVATLVPSGTSSNEYGWLGEFPGMREWIGERVIRQLGTHDYTLKNRKFELSVGFKLDDLADDNIGIYAPRMQGLGDAAARHPDELMFEAVQLGLTSKCYDGQNFFDRDHPVLDKEGKAQSVSNSFGAGDGKAKWYLLDASRALKPFIRQQRKKPEFTALTDTTSERVFMLDEVLYGVSSREAAGYGFWQMASVSQADFTAANFAEVYTSMTSMTGDHDKKLTLKPNILLVPTSLEDAARLLMTAEKIGNEVNPHRNKCKIVVCPWLDN